MTIDAIFFDDGGVMNDNNLRGKQWKPLIAEFFAPRFGGEKENWMKANEYAVGFVMDILDHIQAMNKEISHKDYYALEHEVWAEKMFEFMGMQNPPKETYEKLALEVDNWVIPQVRSAYPGITDSIQKLSKNYILHTASNETSKVLDAYLAGMDVRNCFKFLFGPDLINTMKSHQSYYQKIFSYAQVKPENTVVIDDNPGVLKHAEKTKATVIQSCLDGQNPEFENYFLSTNELESIVYSLDKKN